MDSRSIAQKRHRNAASAMADKLSAKLKEASPELREKLRSMQRENGGNPEDLRQLLETLERADITSAEQQTNSAKTNVNSTAKETVPLFTRFKEEQVANAVYLARYFASHDANFAAFCGSGGLLDADAVAKLHGSAADLAMKFAARTELLPKTSSPASQSNGFVAAVLRPMYAKLGRLLAETNALSGNAVASSSVSAPPSSMSSIVQQFKLSPRSSLVSVMRAFFAAVADWDCEHGTGSAGAPDSELERSATVAEIALRMVDEENIPRCAPGDIPRYLQEIRNEEHRATLFGFVELLQEEAQEEETIQQKVSAVDGQEENIDEGRERSSSDNISNGGNSRSVSANPLLFFFPQFMFYCARWFDIYDATLKGEEVDSFLEHVSERNSEMRADNARSNPERLRGAWQQVTRHAPAGPAAPLDAQSQYQYLDDIEITVADSSNPQIEEELAMLVDVDESARIDSSALWNYKGDDFRHMWKYASRTEKIRFVERCRQNALEMEDTKTGMFFCPEISADELILPEGSAPDAKDPLISLIERVTSYTANINQLDPFMSRLALHLQRQNQEISATAKPGKELLAAQKAGIMPFGRKTISTIVYTRRVVLCKFVVNIVFVVLRLGEGAEENDDEAPAPIDDLTEIATRPDRKAPEFKKVEPGVRPSWEPTWRKKPAEPTESSVDSSSNGVADSNGEGKGTTDPDSSTADNGKADVKFSPEEEVLSGEPLARSPIELALELQASKLWDCAFPGCTNSERDDGGAKKFAGCGFCKKVGEWVPYCSRGCQAKHWAAHKPHCGGTGH